MAALLYWLQVRRRPRAGHPDPGLGSETNMSESPCPCGTPSCNIQGWSLTADVVKSWPIPTRHSHGYYVEVKYLSYIIIIINTIIFIIIITIITIIIIILLLLLLLLVLSLIIIAIIIITIIIIIISITIIIFLLLWL